MKPQSFAKSQGYFLPKQTARLLCWCASIGFFLACPAAQAGTTWDGGGGATTNINTAANWDSDALPSSLTDGTQTLTFGTGGSTATINTDVNALGLVINRDANFAIADGGGNLTVGTGGITVTLPTTTARTHTISENNLILGGNQTWSVTNNTGTATLNVSSAISDGPSTFGISKNGTGVLALSGANTYDGATTINAGTLTISKNTALGSTVGGTTIASGASLNLQGDITVGAEALTHNGGTSGYLRNVSGNNTWNGDITVGANNSRIRSDAGLLTIGGNITMTLAPIFEGAGNISITGVVSGSSVFTMGANMAGVLTLSGNNTFTGATYVSSGTLSVSSINNQSTNGVFGNNTTQIYLGGATTNGTLLYTGAGVTTDRRIRVGGASAVTDTGNAIIRNDGGGALVFSNAAFNQATGSTTSNRTLTLRGTNTDLNTIQGAIVDNTASTGLVGLIKADAGTWVLSGANTYSGATSINSGILVFRNISARSANTTVTVGAAGIVGLGVGAGSGDYSDANVADLFNSTLTGFTLNATSGVALDTTAGNFTQSTALTASRALTKLGNNTLTLNGSNTYSGDTTISAGTLALGASGSLGGGSYSGNIANSGTFTLNTTATQTLSGIISGNGSLTKSNTGTLTLSGSNTYTGNTTVSLGVINIQHANGLGTTANGTTVSSGAALQLQGGITIGAEALSLTGNGVSTDGALRNISGSNTYEGVITLAGATRINSDADLLTLSGGISGAQNLTIGGAGNTTISSAIATSTGTLTKDGAGMLVLSANNTYIGATAVGTSGGANAGTLQLSGLGKISTAATSIFGGTLDLNGTNQSITTLSMGGGVSGSTAAVTTGSGTLTLGGNVDFSATNNANGASISGNLDLGAATRTFTIGDSSAASADLTISAIISNGNLTKSGTGTLVLSGNNTYTGNTTVSLGVINIQHANGLGTTANGTTVSSGAALQLQGGITIGAEALSLNGTGVSTDGALRNISGINSYEGVITLAGATRINSDAGLLTLSGGIGGATQNLTIGGAGNTTINSAIATTTGTLTKDEAGTLTLSGANTFTGGATINAGTLQLGNAGALNSTAGSENAVSFGASSTGSLSLNGNSIVIRSLNSNATPGTPVVQNANAAAATLTVGNSANASSTYAGVIQDGTGGGALSLTKAGTGTLTLSGSNSYAGNTTISAGVLNIRNNTALGTTAGGTTVASGAALQLQGDITVTGEALSLTGGGINTNGALRNISGNNAWTGDIVVGVNNTRIHSDLGSLLTISGNISTPGFSTIFQGNGTTIMSGVISGSSGGVALSTTAGIPIVTLTGNNTYTGATSINGGTLTANTLRDFGVSSSLGNGTAGTAIPMGQVQNNATLIYTGGATSSNRTIQIGQNSATPASSDTGSATIQNDGSGALVFTAANFNNQLTTASGAAANRTLTLSGSNTDSNTISGVIRDNIVSGTATGTATIGLIKSGTGTWVLSGNNTYTGATTINAGTLQIGAGGTSGNLSISSSITNNGTLVFNRSGTITQGTNFANSISGTGNLTQAGSGTLVLGGTNSYTGLTTISAGNLSISTVSAVANTSGINLANATSLIYTGSAATLDRDISVTAGTGTIRNNGGALTLTGGLSKNGTTLTLAGGSNGITVSGAISGSNANSDLIIDGGTTTLTNANTYNGPTFIINSGTLSANIAGALPTSTLSAVTINGSSTLALGASQSVASLSGTSGSTVNLNANTLTINGSSSTTYSGGISGTGNLVKNGSGTQTLAGATTFNGTTTVNSGTLQAATANALANTSQVVLNNGGSFLVTAENAVNDNAAINLNGGRMAMSGNFNETVGALTLSANSTLDFSGFVGTLRFGSIASWTTGANLAIWNWSGRTQYGTDYGTYPNSSNLVFTNNATLTNNLANISFYSDSGITSIGSGFELGFTGSGGGSLIIAVPEPETYFYAVALLAGVVVQYLRRRAKR